MENAYSQGMTAQHVAMNDQSLEQDSIYITVGCIPDGKKPANIEIAREFTYKMLPYRAMRTWNVKNSHSMRGQERYLTFLGLYTYEKLMSDCYKLERKLTHFAVQNILRLPWRLM